MKKSEKPSTLLLTQENKQVTTRKEKIQEKYGKCMGYLSISACFMLLA